MHNGRTKERKPQHMSVFSGRQFRKIVREIEEAQRNFRVTRRNQNHTTDLLKSLPIYSTYAYN